ncbi:MAG: hypothetical protein ACI8VT_004138 [Saprospiraceae bacterium]
MAEEKIYVISFQNNDNGSPSAMTLEAAAIVSNVPYPTIKQSIQLSTFDNSRFVGTYLLGGDKERIIGLQKDELF